MKTTKKNATKTSTELQWSDLSRAELELMLDADEIEAKIESGEIEA